MRAGTLNKKIVFRGNTFAPNGLGERVEQKIDVLITWASIQTISGKEQFLSNKNYATLSHKIRCRYSDKINQKQTIKYKDREFKILAVLDIFEKNREQEILVEEVVK